MSDTDKKQLHIHNKSDKPDNVVMKENQILEECEAIQKQLPSWMRGYFTYLRGNLLPMSRRGYLQDIRFFCQYLIDETDLTQATATREIKEAEFREITAADVNLFLDHCRRYKKETEKAVYIYENSNKSLARKRSSVSVLFKYLYRSGIVEKNITDGFDPIRLPKPGERQIKALQDDEVMRMLDAVTTGEGLTNHERSYWEKTKYRDKCILMYFVTYGLRLSELQQLNVSSFNFSRGEFLIYRKRGKESTMPLNKTTIKALRDYLDLERPKDDTLDEEHKDALFLSLQGKRMTERQIRELVKKYTSICLDTTRRNGYSPHKLRATAATSLIGRGSDIYDVQVLLDHDNVTTTQLYAAHKLNTKRDLIKSFEWGDDLEEYLDEEE